MDKTLYEMLLPERLTEIVDIGANPVDGDPPYKPMLAAALCHVTGCEPQEQALAELAAKIGPLERYLPYAVGDGEQHKLYICRESGMTSVLEPDPATLKIFDFLRQCAEVVRCVPVTTRRLDDIAEIAHCDYLKIDVQGSELAVFKGGENVLAQAVVIQTEVSFIALYKNQPTFGDIDVELRRQGFIPHCYTGIKHWPIAPCVLNNDPRLGLNQLLEADIVYVRDFTRPDTLSSEQLKHLILVAHYCYGSIDLALHGLMLLEQRQELPQGSQQRYLRTANVKAR